MKQFFTITFSILCSFLVQAQFDCSQLFISEYVEGWSNNKAIEIYNPTPNAVDLSGYTLSRYSNGSTEPSSTQLEGTIEPFETFVVGLDKRDPNGEGYEAPMWDGNYTYIDSITGQEVTTYNELSDLQGKIDLFVNPIYYFGNNADSAIANPTTMYFNGNDAVVLQAIGAFIPADIVGRIGEDPGAAWTDNDGNYWTKDHTLIRKPSVQGGVLFNPTIFDPTLEWDSLSVNTFENLGSHECLCNPNSRLIEDMNSFVVYPNPTTSSDVRVSNNLAISNIKLHNSLGQLIIEKDISNLNHVDIELPNKKGIYFLNLKDAKGIKTKSILVK